MELSPRQIETQWRTAREGFVVAAQKQGVDFGDLRTAFLDLPSMISHFSVCPYIEDSDEVEFKKMKKEDLLAEARANDISETLPRVYIIAKLMLERALQRKSEEGSTEMSEEEEAKDTMDVADSEEEEVSCAEDAGGADSEGSESEDDEMQETEDVEVEEDDEVEYEEVEDEDEDEEDEDEEEEEEEDEDGEEEEEEEDEDEEGEEDADSEDNRFDNTAVATVSSSPVITNLTKPVARTLTTIEANELAAAKDAAAFEDSVKNDISLYDPVNSDDEAASGAGNQVLMSGWYGTKSAFRAVLRNHWSNPDTMPVEDIVGLPTKGEFLLECTSINAVWDVIDMFDKRQINGSMVYIDYTNINAVKLPRTKFSHHQDAGNEESEEVDGDESMEDAEDGD